MQTEGADFTITLHIVFGILSASPRCSLSKAVRLPRVVALALQDATPICCFEASLVRSPSFHQTINCLLGGEAMRWRNILLMTGILVFVLPISVAAQDWVDIKDPKELRALHSNKTFRCHLRESPYLEHYRADGKGMLVYSKEWRVACTWEVKGNDQVCVSDVTGTDCYQFQRSTRTPGEYVRKNTKDSWTLIFRVEDGIPQF